VPEILLDPTGFLGRKPATDIERDLAETADELQREFGRIKSVRASLRNILEFTRGPLAQFPAATMELLKTNPPALGGQPSADGVATTSYLEDFRASARNGTSSSRNSSTKLEK
jgi:hypothetical protein